MGAVSGVEEAVDRGHGRASAAGSARARGPAGSRRAAAAPRSAATRGAAWAGGRDLQVRLAVAEVIEREREIAQLVGAAEADAALQCGAGIQVQRSRVRAGARIGRGRVRRVRHRDQVGRGKPADPRAEARDRVDLQGLAAARSAHHGDRLPRPDRPAQLQPDILTQRELARAGYRIGQHRAGRRRVRVAERDRAVVLERAAPCRPQGRRDEVHRPRVDQRRSGGDGEHDAAAGERPRSAQGRRPADAERQRVGIIRAVR